MHPVDFMALLPDKSPKETVRVVAVLAENGRTGRTTTFERTFEPPTQRGEGQSLKFREILDAENQHGVREHVVEERDGKLFLKVVVRGDDNFGAKGRFKAVYRVWWG